MAVDSKYLEDAERLANRCVGANSVAMDRLAKIVIELIRDRDNLVDNLASAEEARDAEMSHNLDADYDGEALIAVSKSRVARDIVRSYIHDRRMRGDSHKV